jgi:hypothetical protein
MKFKVTDSNTNTTHIIEAENAEELYMEAMVELVQDADDEEGIQKFGKDWLVSITYEEVEIADDLNPAFIFSLTKMDLLVQIANGSIDALQLAKDELANRGLNLKGEWVGFSNTKNK